MKRAYKAIYMQDLPFEEAKQQIAEQANQYSELLLLRDFLETSKRGIIR